MVVPKRKRSSWLGNKSSECVIDLGVVIPSRFLLSNIRYSFIGFSRALLRNGFSKRALQFNHVVIPYHAITMLCGAIATIATF